MNDEIKKKLDSYPKLAREQLTQVRDIIFQVAKDEGLGEVVETLKWGEFSYRTKYGSPLRIDWKPKSPDTFSIYFNCNTRLVETFKELFQDEFRFIGNRELQLLISEDIPINAVKGCISLSLRYHKIKHLPLLGA